MKPFLCLNLARINFLSLLKYEVICFIQYEINFRILLHKTMPQTRPERQQMSPKSSKLFVGTPKTRHPRIESNPTRTNNYR